MKETQEIIGYTRTGRPIPEPPKDLTDRIFRIKGKALKTAYNTAKKESE
jgi:hypothetical protein